MIESNLNRLKNVAAKDNRFEEFYNQINNEYQVLMTTEQEKLVLRQRGLRERLVNEKNVKKGLQEQIKSFENAVNRYQVDIYGVQRRLEEFFVESDNLRVELTKLQEKYQQIKADIEKYTPQLTICKAEILEYLADIDIAFDVYDDYQSSARYVDARKKLENIEEMVMNLYGNIETIANYCNTIEVVIPGLLKDLFNKNKDLELKGYVVSHARVPEFINNTNIVLEGLKNDFKHLCFAHFEDIYKEIQAKLTEVHAHLDQEVASKNDLDARYNVVSRKISEAEANFIQTKRHFATMKEYYQLPDDIGVRFSKFEHNSTYLADLKREYEGYIFADVHNPATYMLEKVAKMDELCDSVNDDIKYFIQYFDNSKQYVEQTYAKVLELMKNLTILLGKIRYNKCHKIYEKYAIEIQQLIEQFKNINAILLEKPIKLSVLYQSFNNLVMQADDISNNVENEIENFKTVEKTIVFTNPLRYQFSAVDETLKEAEEYFKKGDYVQAQNKLKYILSNYHPAAFESFKE